MKMNMYYHQVYVDNNNGGGKRLLAYPPGD